MKTEQSSIKWSQLTHYNEKQKEADEALKLFKYILYGGAVGGGKSYWLRWSLIKLLLHYHALIKKPGIRVGLFCEDYPALKDRHISKMSFELPSWLGRLKKGDNEYELAPEYGSGVVAMRNLDDPSKYASSEFAAIGIDELTKNTKDKFDHLRTRMRWPGIKDTKFLSGTNPGSIGHEWVKSMWMDKTFDVNEKEAKLFKYVRATAYDNREHLDDNYFMQLEGLPEEMRKAFLEGNWDLFEGQYFSEWRYDIHTIIPFELPKVWRRFGGYDHGRAKPACFKWYAVDWDGNVWVYRELYVNKEDGSERWEANQIAREINKITEEAGEILEYVVADSAIFSKIGTGESIGEIFRKNGVGEPGTAIPMLIPSHKDRIAGWAIMHQYFKWDKWNQPKMKYFRTCVDSIRTIPTLVYDSIKVEDLDSSGEDHCADVDRYFLQTMREKKSDKTPSYTEVKMKEFEKKVINQNSVNRLDFFNNL
jgi:hypothetical protein|tara:strand:+ start:641 stop:2071 length:1431 start_codon:yes stop_codon:yes gene_type:complete